MLRKVRHPHNKATTTTDAITTDKNPLWVEALKNPVPSQQDQVNLERTAANS